MALCPSRTNSVILKGKFEFRAHSRNAHPITDSYDLQITVSSTFPKSLPDVLELGGKIPRDGKHHVNRNGTLCLGSPVRLLSLLAKKPTLTGFSENCVVPFLYAVSHKLQYGGDFIFSELAHGERGIIDDYMKLFGVTTKEQVINVLTLIGMKQRLANKKPCPCDCSKRLGACHFNKRILWYRTIASRAWFRGEAAAVAKGD